MGYFDSLSGLLFFLLCGRWFQQKTFDRLAFDRDYRSFFPLSVKRLRAHGEESVAVSQLQLGDRLSIRNGELLPADARLMEGEALIDYSFVTGEAEPVSKVPGDHLYAGGRQVGGAIEVETLKPVSEGYLTSLWNQEAFQKPEEQTSLQTLTNRYSQRFTKIIVGIALGAACYWWWANPLLALKAFTSVLIVACPCALALAAPFALGTAQRVLARRGIYLKNPAVIERLAAVDSIVFDKTGTLTVGAAAPLFHGAPLSAQEGHWIKFVALHSSHPLAVRLGQAVPAAGTDLAVNGFREVPGCGIEGHVEGHQVRMGSENWLKQLAIFLSPGSLPHSHASASASMVHVAIDNKYRGWFELRSGLRPEVGKLLKRLATQYELALISGDTDRDRMTFAQLFGPDATVQFQQSPLEKLEFVRARQKAGRTVLMVGDGLNDSGALQQSDVGVAVVETLSAFSPASDVILAASMVPELFRVAAFAKAAVRVVRASFLISSIYNVIGISIAARGLLAPVVCAVLMPLSSVTVVAFACSLTGWLGPAIFAGPLRWGIKSLKERFGHMTVIFLLIPLSVVIATGFLGAFIWAVRSGQDQDTCTPAMRLLHDRVDELGPASLKKEAAPLGLLTKATVQSPVHPQSTAESHP